MKVSEYYGLDMYSDSGYYVGEVQDVMLGVKKSEVVGLVLERGEGRNKMIPYKNVMAVGDMILVESEKGIGIIVDFAPNHSNLNDNGVYGELHDNGEYVIDYKEDNEKATFNEVEQSWQNIYHHNGGVDDWNNNWDVRYQDIFALADFNHMNEWVDSYHKEAASKFLKRDIQGFRIDASKDMNQGWLKTLADNIYAQRNVFIMHEWYQNFGDEMMWDLAKFDNQSGMHELNTALNKTIRDTFARDSSSLVNLDDRVQQQETNFKWNHKLLNFVDSHDRKRFMNILHSKRMFEIANGFAMTTPGIPVIYYGTEQYLHSNEGTGDPYNRPMMDNWNRDTTMYHLIENLSKLRKENPALRYGLTSTRYVSSSEGGSDNGVYVFERKFFNNVVLVALSKCSKDVTLSNVNTALPDGTYQDYLGGLLDGQSISVSGGQIDSLSVPAKSFAVWQYKESSPSGPHVGAINPTTARAGSRVRISGEGFGSTAGNVYLQSAEGTWSSTIKAWTSSDIEFIVPEGASTSLGNQFLKVYVEDANGNVSNKIDLYYLSGRQIPVVHEVENTDGTALETSSEEYLFITGSENEYSRWSDNSTETLGPMYCPDWPDWFFTTSAPASETVEFKHIRATLGGTGTWESGSNHVFTTPSSGVKYVVVEANGS